jgi:hypothetical protein
MIGMRRLNGLSDTAAIRLILRVKRLSNNVDVQSRFSCLKGKGFASKTNPLCLGRKLFNDYKVLGGVGRPPWAKGFVVSERYMSMISHRRNINPLNPLNPLSRDKILLLLGNL